MRGMLINLFKPMVISLIFIMEFVNDCREIGVANHENMSQTDSYNYSAALTNIYSALNLYDEEAIRAVLDDELKRLPAPAADLFKFVPYSGDLYERDRYSTSLVHRFLGLHGAPFTAARVNADGSCLFHSASMRINGKLIHACSMFISFTI